jgi:hypothetical protein
MDRGNLRRRELVRDPDAPPPDAELAAWQTLFLVPRDLHDVRVLRQPVPQPRHGNRRVGTDPSRSKKARDWAAPPVNLLNVAVSRARRRLFVIGSHGEWSAARNFDKLAAALPVRHWSISGQ